MANIAFLAERMRLGFGVDLMVDQLARGLSLRGHRVTVFTCFSDGTYSDGPYRIVSFPIAGHPEALVWDGRALKAASGSGLYDLPFDVWIALTPPFFSLLPRLGGRGIAVDCGVSARTGMPRRQRRNFRTTELLQQQWYFRSAARVITISRWLHDQLPKAVQRKAIPIHLGADHYPVAGPEERQVARKFLGLADDDVLSLYIGRLNPTAQPYKGTERLLAMHRQIVEKYPESKLALVGFGDETDEEWVRNQGAIPVVNAPVDQMPGLLAAADIYVTASAWEGFDLPLVEAQRSGKPVVAFRIGAHPEVVDHGRSGVLVDDEEAFIEAVGHLVHDEEHRQDFGDSAVRWTDRFRWDETVAAYDALIHDVLNEVGTILPPRRSRSLPRSVSDGDAETEARVRDACFYHPPVSVIILNYGADEETLRRCVASVLASHCQRVLEIIVADNGSKRNLDALDSVAALDDRVQVVRFGENFGFSGGINRALMLCDGEWVMILNNDTEVDPMALDECARVLASESHDCIAAVPKLLLAQYPTVLDAIGNAVDGLGQAYNMGLGQVDVGQYDASMRLFGPCFAAALFRREAFDVNMVGPLDASYFMYYEDVDWNWRANLMGYRFRSAPRAKVFHEHSKTTREQPPAFKYELIHSHLLTTVAKNMPTRTATKVVGYHLRAHVRAAVEGDMRATRLRLIAGAVRRAPMTVAKRQWVRRHRTVPDESVIALGQLDPMYLDNVTYTPMVNLRSLATAYRCKWRATGDPRWAEVADRATWLDEHPALCQPGVIRRLILPLLEDEPEFVRRQVKGLDPIGPVDVGSDSEHRS